MKKVLIFLALALCLAACQKRTFDLAFEEKPADAPQSNLELDPNRSPAQ